MEIIQMRVMVNSLVDLIVKMEKRFRFQNIFQSLGLGDNLSVGYNKKKRLLNKPPDFQSELSERRWYHLLREAQEGKSVLL